MQHNTMQDSLIQDRGMADMVMREAGTQLGTMGSAAPGTRRITIVGAGFSGTLTAVRLLHFAEAPLEICLIEREEGYRYGGIAFGRASTNWEHMLNIQAGRITLRRERPEDFLEWANDEADRSDWPQKWQYHTFGVACVVPRRIFRQYLAERLRHAAADAHADVTLRELTGEVIDVRGQGGGYVVKYAGTQGGVHDLPSDQVILATGHLSPVQAPFYHRIKDSDRFIADPYAPGAQQRFQEVGTEDTVLVTGSALSAFDTVISLVHAGHRGQILICSRGGHTHGTYPVDHEHDIWQAGRPSFLDAEKLTPEVVVEGVKAEYARLRTEHGVEPGSALDAVFPERVMKAWEPYVIELVSRMDPRDVRMLLDRYKSLIVTNRTSTVREIGSVVRSRMRGFNGAPKTVEVMSAAIQDMRPVEGGTKIRVVFADQPDLVVDRVVNCLGNNTDYERSDHPLWNGLVNGHGYAQPQTKTHRGIEVGPHGQLIAADGNVAPGLFGVGPMRQGDETTRRGRLGAFVFSIGTLRNQCFDTAMEVLRRLRPASDEEQMDIPDGIHHCLIRSSDWIAADLATEEPQSTRLRERLQNYARESAYPNAVNYLQAQDRTERRKYRGILDDDLADFGARLAREFDLTAQQAQRTVSLLTTLVEKHAVHNLCDITKLAGWDSQYGNQVQHAPKKDA
ncbi:FAD/NAD(P)-binding protein [Streptomyces coeruleorubidus]|uniref:FAD/NAD(P)-binding protein n=1 Tax=Streptomyces coeruleorubidus TaxID=116188 RepID=UPI00237F5044|nr:FAD/NAD(P)-binding protein [Streptomyces coeruleorubidus]WDV57062.1 FAD/NAD(P)-binding protein [Streptomyces coeruleorubidus]